MGRIRMKNIKKQALITGASRGIGYGVANCFLEQGLHVYGTATTHGACDIHDSNFEPIILDFLKPESIDNAILLLKGKPIHFLINNAAVLLEPWDDSSVNMKDLRLSFEVNLFGLIDFTERILPFIQPYGHIINVSSSWGAFNDSVTQFQQHYKLTKAALNMYTKILSDRLKDQHITVSSINPGWVKTDMGGSSAPKSVKQAASDIFNLATAETIPSGCFWENGKIRSW